MALLEVNFFSDVLGLCTSMNVILPQNSDETACLRNDDGTYPVLYLLHGMSDDHTAWIRKTSIDRYAEKYGVAIVMPTTHLGWYTDMDMGYKYFTFLTEELPEICRSFFPNISPKREHTFAAGLSMGGYGALKCGLRAPEVFSAVATLSGAVHMAANKYPPETAGYWTDIFGDLDKFEGSFNDLAAAAREFGDKPPVKIYQYCGTEDFLYEQNKYMHKLLDDLGFDLTYEEGPGDHQWKYWDQKIQTVLDWLPIKKLG